MDRFHRTSRGWLAQRLRGREWWVLTLFLLFYLGLIIGPGQQWLETHRLVMDSTVPTESSEAISHAEPEEHTQQAETFLGLP